MRWSKPEVDRYVSSLQRSSPSLKERNVKGFLFAKLYLEAGEPDLAKRHVSQYLEVQAWDAKAHRFLGRLLEKERRTDEALACYARSVELNPAQKDLVLKVAEMLAERQSDGASGGGRAALAAERWAERAAGMLPAGHPAVFALRERLLSRQGGREEHHHHRLVELLRAQLAARPSDPHVNGKLVALYRQDGRLEEAVRHCLAVERRGLLRHSLDWSSVLLDTLEVYLEVEEEERRPSRDGSKPRPSPPSRREELHVALLLARCNRLRLALSERGLDASLDALKAFDRAVMQQASRRRPAAVAPRGQPPDDDELQDTLTEMRGHLYLHSATLLLKMAQEKEQQWRAVVEPAALCYLLAYQAPRPRAKAKARSRGGEDPTTLSSARLLELLASDRQSQAGHMLFNLAAATEEDMETTVKLLVERFGNDRSRATLSELLFGAHVPTGTSFIANDSDIFLSLKSRSFPKLPHLVMLDNDSVALHGGDLQHLSWLALQWAVQGGQRGVVQGGQRGVVQGGHRASLQDWLKQLFPRLSLETSKMDTDAPESICLLDLEVFVCGVAFCGQSALQNKAGGLNGGGGRQPRCLPLPLLRPPSTNSNNTIHPMKCVHPSIRHAEWWEAAYSLVHKRARPDMLAKLRMIVQRGLSVLRARQKHGLQPALLIHWARHLGHVAMEVDSDRERKEYAGRSKHYRRAVRPLLDMIRRGRSIPRPLQPLFEHFHSRAIQISALKDIDEDLDRLDEEEEVVSGQPAESRQPSIHPHQDKVSGDPLHFQSPTTPPPAAFNFNNNILTPPKIVFVEDNGPQKNIGSSPTETSVSWSCSKAKDSEAPGPDKVLPPQAVTDPDRDVDVVAHASSKSAENEPKSTSDTQMTPNTDGDGNVKTIREHRHGGGLLASHFPKDSLERKPLSLERPYSQPLFGGKIPDSFSFTATPESSGNEGLSSKVGNPLENVCQSENASLDSSLKSGDNETEKPTVHDEAALLKTKFAEAQKIVPMLPEKNEEHEKKESESTQCQSMTNGATGLTADFAPASGSFTSISSSSTISISTLSVEEPNLDQFALSAAQSNTSSLLDLSRTTGDHLSFARNLTNDFPLGHSHSSSRVSSPENSGSSTPSPSPPPDNGTYSSYSCHKWILRPATFVYKTSVSSPCSKASDGVAPVPQTDGVSGSNRDVDVVYVRQASAGNEPEHTSDPDTDDNHNHQSVVETLNGKFSPDLTEVLDSAQEFPEPHDLGQQPPEQLQTPQSREALAPQASTAREALAPQAAIQESRDEAQDLLETLKPQIVLQRGPEPQADQELSPQMLTHETPGRQTPLGEQSEEALNVSPVSVSSTALEKRDSCISHTNALYMDPETETILGQEVPQPLGPDAPVLETPELQTMGQEAPVQSVQETPEPQTMGQDQSVQEIPEPESLVLEEPVPETPEQQFMGQPAVETLNGKLSPQLTEEVQDPAPQVAPPEQPQTHAPAPRATMAQETPESKVLPLEAPAPQAVDQESREKPQDLLETPQPQNLVQEDPKPESLQGHRTPEPQTLDDEEIQPQPQDLDQEATAAPQGLLVQVAREQQAQEEKHSRQEMVEQHNLVDQSKEGQNVRHISSTALVLSTIKTSEPDSTTRTSTTAQTPNYTFDFNLFGGLWISNLKFGRQVQMPWTKAPDMVCEPSSPPAPKKGTGEEGYNPDVDIQGYNPDVDIHLEPIMSLQRLESGKEEDEDEEILLLKEWTDTESEGQAEQLAGKTTPELSEFFGDCECQKNAELETPSLEVLVKEAPGPQTLSQQAPESLSLEQETLGPQTLNQEAPGLQTLSLEAPGPQTMGQETPEPLYGGQNAMEHQSLLQGGTEPPAVGKEAPEPQILEQESSEPQILEQETAEPQTLSEESPLPETMGQETPESLSLDQETPESMSLDQTLEPQSLDQTLEPQPLGHEAPEPLETPASQSLIQKTPEPLDGGLNVLEPQTLLQDGTEPTAVGKALEPQILEQETPEPQTLAEESPDLCHEAPEPQTMDEETPESLSLDQVISGPQTLVLEPPEPPTMDPDTLEPPYGGQNTVEPQTLLQDGTEPLAMGKEAPEPQILEQETPEPQTLDQETPESLSLDQTLEPQPLGHEAPEPLETPASQSLIQKTPEPLNGGLNVLEPQTLLQDGTEPTAVIKEALEPQTLEQETPEPQTLAEESPEPQSLCHEVPEPQTMGEETPESLSLDQVISGPQTLGLEAPEPQILLQDGTEPTAVGKAPEPQILDRETPGPQTLDQDTPEPLYGGQNTVEPQTLGEESPEPQSLDRETPKPLNGGLNVLEPQTLLQDGTEPTAVIKEALEPHILEQETPEPQFLGQKNPEPLDLDQNVMGPLDLLWDGTEPLAVGMKAPEKLNLGKDDATERQDPCHEETPTPQALLLQDNPDPQALLCHEEVQPEPQALLCHEEVQPEPQALLGHEEVQPEPQALLCYEEVPSQPETTLVQEEAPKDQVPSLEETLSSPQAMEEQETESGSCSPQEKLIDGLNVVSVGTTKHPDLNCEPDSATRISAAQNTREEDLGDEEEAPVNTKNHFEPNLATHWEMKENPSAVCVLPSDLLLGPPPNKTRTTGCLPVWPWFATGSPVPMGHLRLPAANPQHTALRASQHSSPANPLVFLSVAEDGEPLGSVTVELFHHLVPRTAENFRALCTGEKGFGFKNSVFHRVVPNFMCQGGDITRGDGTGGRSIYGDTFEDENFDVRHTTCGLLAMANRGRNTNTSQFYITLTKAPRLDFKHVVFGWVRDGMEVVRRMGELGTKSGKPSKTLMITDCGQVSGGP